MSLNGGGVYNVNSAGQPVVSNTLITAAVFNAFTADIATALSSAIFKDGQQTVTANIPFGGFRLTGVGAASARTDAASLASIQDGTGVYVATVGGTANAITLTCSPAITAYAAGQVFWFKAASLNTGATTIAISGLATIAAQRNGIACVGGEIVANKWYRISLDTTSTCQLEQLSGEIQPVATVAAHATTMNPWVAQIVIASGGAVTFTDIADAPYAGAVVWMKMNAAHVFTDGAVFNVQGNANYTAAADDWIRIYATTVSTFEVTVFKSDGSSVVGFTTGDVKLTIKTVADSGWVLMNDGTMGNGSSGGTTRANADTESLFTLLWNNTADADCAVSSGRGANAAADFAANKTIALPKALGRALGVYGAGSGLTSRAMAKITGVETHPLITAELAAHTHPQQADTILQPAVATASSTGGAAKSVGGTTQSTGSGTAHQNMQPTVFLNVMIKL